MGTELCKDKNKSTRICCSCLVRFGGGCAMANFLLLPSFHLKICLAAFQLFAERPLLLLPLLLLLLPGKDLQIIFPLKLTWYQTWYQHFSARACAGAEGAGRQASSGCICAAQTGIVGAARAGRDAGELAGEPDASRPASARFPCSTLPLLKPFLRPWQCNLLSLRGGRRVRLASPTECPPRAP